MSDLLRYKIMVIVLIWVSITDRIDIINIERMEGFFRLGHIMHALFLIVVAIDTVKLT